MQCQRANDKPSCPLCGVNDLDPCPLTEAVDLPGEPISAGATGVCAIDNPECDSCQ